jgi:hypothetical protein
MKNFDYEYFLVAGLLLTWLFIVAFYAYGMAERQFKSRGKKIKKGWLQHLVRNRRLTPLERLGSRIGYLGAGLLIAAQWTVAPPLYIGGFICVLVQTTIRKQWNLVLLQINGLIAWIIHLLF